MEYLAQAAEDAGLCVSFCDLCFADDAAAELARSLGETTPALVAVTLRNTDDCYMATRHSFLPDHASVVQTIRQHSDVPVVLGGAGYSVAPREVLLKTGADYGIVGDGEAAIVALARSIRDHTSFDHIPGLLWREDGEIRTNPPSWPAFGQEPLRRRTIDNLRYFRGGGQGNVETKRGCNQQCIYCADPAGKGARLRLRPPKAVVGEVGHLLTQGVDVLHLCDSEFNIPGDHARAVCDEMILQGLGERVRWYAYLSPTPFDADLARTMRRAGCAGINFGTDSGSARILKSLGRAHSPEDIRVAVRACREAGLPVMIDLLLGVPGETLESVSETIALMHALEPDCVGVAVGVRLYPGTRVSRQVLGSGEEAAPPGVTCSGDWRDLSEPVFFLEPAIADDIMPHIKRLIAGDQRFFVGGPDESQMDYNYDDNSALSNAIAAGARGAYWDILRKLSA
ncbi:MAG: radical SAM protein [Armatimonadetes bacterium]|nr:radical SAM protein [Armatimonadota bacterium]